VWLAGSLQALLGIVWLSVWCSVCHACINCIACPGLPLWCAICAGGHVVLPPVFALACAGNKQNWWHTIDCTVVLGLHLLCFMLLQAVLL
jgi:hypothetical protein